MFPCNIYVLLLALVGFLYLFFFFLDSLWSILQGIRAILAPFFIQNEETSLVKKYGQWALVTGCTDGIGREYAKELAKRGINIVLVSRTEEKLKKTAQELESEYAVKTKIIAADFSLGPKAIEIVKKELGSLEIGILVNNVGKNYEYPMYLGEVDEKELWDIININVGAVTLLCRMFVERMKKNGRGAIVNVSSGSELQPLPLMTVYAATKAYIKSFTQALRYEYSKYGITIQQLSPMFINTKMNQFSSRLRQTSLFIPDAAGYAKQAVASLGKMDSTTGYWSHGIQVVRAAMRNPLPPFIAEVFMSCRLNENSDYYFPGMWLENVDNILYFLTSIPPVWIRMHIGGLMGKALRRDYLKEIGNKAR